MEDPKIIEARRLIMEKFHVKDLDLVFVEKIENERLVKYSFSENSKRFRVSFLGEKVIDIFRY
ncbi:MAG: hypothetical protein KI791_10600 [Cyclobacteriaceae bacterium]|nr:hypothetical protein [Cyclobacteriaceae bacterium SS2]